MSLARSVVAFAFVAAILIFAAGWPQLGSPQHTRNVIGLTCVLAALVAFVALGRRRQIRFDVIGWSGLASLGTLVIIGLVKRAT